MLDYAKIMRRLIEDIVARCTVFAHVDTTRLLIGCVRARTAGPTGLYARTVPLRFEGGSPTTERGGRTYRVPRVVQDGKEMLYIVSFCLPRFHELSLEDKLTTVFHELYHVSPLFNGDIRRFEGSNYVHSASQRKYDELMRVLAQEYLAGGHCSQVEDFLKPPYSELCEKYGGIMMTVYRSPKPELVATVQMPATAREGRRKGKKKK